MNVETLKKSELKLTTVHVARKKCEKWPENIPRFSHIKHWGVVLFRYDLVAERDLTPQIIDAIEDENHVLFCELSEWDGPTKRKWETTPGFKLEKFKLEEKEHTYSHDALRAYIKSFNDEKQEYHSFFNNCHKFVLDLLCHLELDDVARELIPMSTAPDYWKTKPGEVLQYPLKSISQSSINEFKIDFPKLLGEVEGTDVEKLAKISWGSGTFIPATDSAKETKAGSLFPAIAWKSVQLLKTDPKYFREATTPWRFINVLAEVIVGQLMLRLFPEKKDLADSIASINGDELVPSNSTRGIAMWLIAEAINFLIRLMLTRLKGKDISKFAVQSIRDVFNNIIGPGRILSFYNYAKDSILEGTIRHIVSLQNNEFELFDIEEELEDDTVTLIKEVNWIFQS